jgi:hypothetical protein
MSPTQTQPEQFAHGRYQRILLDAPCTASGIVRRHPDIPWLRRSADVAQLATLQGRMLDALWPLLEPAGRLLYVVCSVFTEEGPRQAEAFAARHADARPLALPGMARVSCGCRRRMAGPGCKACRAFTTASSSRYSKRHRFRCCARPVRSSTALRRTHRRSSACFARPCWPSARCSARRRRRCHDRIEVRSAELRPAADGDGIALDATFDFDLPWVLEDAVSRGVPLYFVVDFELYRSRWYWFDDRRAAASLTYRLSYSPLTREYRLARGTLALPFDTLGRALATMRRVSSWTVVENGALTAGQSYWAQVRMRLDTAQLPRPFQIGAITSRDWTLASEWRNVPVGPDLAR